MLLQRARKSLTPNAATAVLFALGCFFVCSNRAAAQSSFSREPNSGATLANSGFAIADFDGDRKPDLATVEVEKGISRGDTRYSIRFALTSGSAQAFGLTAPAGGLQIVAKDVNGDNALDVLVSTAWEHQQIAVFLNDGHGNFTPADPSRFPAPPQSSGSHWSYGQMLLCESSILVRFENWTSEASAEGEFGQDQPQRRFLPASDSRAATRFLSVSILGRAPPSFVLLA